MKIEFLADGSADCPLVRIYDFNSDQVRQLYAAIQSLADLSADSLWLEQCVPMESIGECRVSAKISKTDYGLATNAHIQNSFVWMLTIETWQDVMGLMEPFMGASVNGYQWLDRRNKISMLLSRDGSW